MPNARRYRSPLIQIRYPLAAVALGVLTTLLLAWLSPFTAGATPARNDFGVVTYEPAPPGRGGVPIHARFRLLGSRTADTVEADVFALDLAAPPDESGSEITPRDLPAWSRAGRLLANGAPLPAGVASRVYHEHAHGWPARAMVATLTVTRFENGGATSETEFPMTLPYEDTFGAGSVPSTQQTLIPMAPLWSGIAANTAVFAAPIWLLMVGPRGLRDRRRRRAGRCRRCGNGVGSLARCPECNTAA